MGRELVEKLCGGLAQNVDVESSMGLEGIRWFEETDHGCAQWSRDPFALTTAPACHAVLLSVVKGGKGRGRLIDFWSHSV